ncbi:MAG: hypothetical protein KDE53_14420 [Caldilineaceae bacterium]|nr:hypothetical protein [Caldilineaceae bacterium]
MSVEQRQSQPTFQLPSWQPLLLAGGVLIALTLAGISWLAYTTEAATSALPGLALSLALATIAGYWLYHMPRTILWDKDQLTLIWLGRAETLALDTISDVQRRRYQLLLYRADKPLRCTFLVPNESTALLTWLEEQIPTVAMMRTATAPQALPITLSPRLTAPILTGSFAGLFGVIGGALVWTSWQQWQRGDGNADLVGMGLFGVVLLLFATLFLYMIIDGYIWRITFDDEAITLRRTLQTERYPAGEVTGLSLVTEERVVKGFSHTLYKLHLTLMDGTTLEIAPNLPSFPMDYAGAEEARLLSDVLAVLERHYRPVVRVDVEPPLVEDTRWGRPLSTLQWQIRPYDLTVTRLDYGEHHAAASTVHFLVGHSTAGAIRFRTTNGEVRISPDGRYIAIFDERLLVVFNLGTGRTYHRASRRGWLYAAVALAGEMIIIEEMRRTNAQQREQRNPISLEQPTSALRRGFGSAATGDFPSAYG